MAKTTTNIFIPDSYSVWSAPFGTTPPTSPTSPPPAAYYETGFLADTGITESHSVSETKIYDLVGQLLAVARNQEERPFTFEAREDNRVIREMMYTASVLSSSGGTSEVQSLAQTATGGTFTLTGGYGGTGVTTAITAPATSASLQTAIRTLPGFSGVIVAGASSPFTVTFPGLGNVSQLAVDNTLAVGGTVTASTTTPGVSAVNTRTVGAGTAQNLRSWLIYVAKGPKHKLFVIGNGEATQTGTPTYTGGQGTVFQFSLQPYPDSSGNFFSLLDDDPAQAVAYS